MAKISGKETKPEVLVRKYLHSKGFRYRKNDKRYPGKPDILITKHKTAVSSKPSPTHKQARRIYFYIWQNCKKEFAYIIVICLRLNLFPKYLCLEKCAKYINGNISATNSRY